MPYERSSKPFFLRLTMGVAVKPEEFLFLGHDPSGAELFGQAPNVFFALEHGGLVEDFVLTQIFKPSSAGDRKKMFDRHIHHSNIYNNNFMAAIYYRRRRYIT